MKWFPARPVVRQGDGHLTLINRGVIKSHQEFAEPVAISFDWRWTDHSDSPIYTDHLTVVLRTAGEPPEERPYEIPDGIAVKFRVYRGSVAIITPASVYSDFMTEGIPMPS